MKKVSKTSSKVIRKLQAEKDDVEKEKMAIIQHLEIEKEQLVENKVAKDDIIQKLKIERE